MRMPCEKRRWLVGAAVYLVMLAIGFSTEAAPGQDKLVPLELTLPAKAFIGTPKDIPLSDVEPLSEQPRPPMMVPAGLKNLAQGAKLTTSDTNTTAATLEKIIDGDKESSEQSIMLLRKGLQYVQLDLGAPAEIFAVVVWHAHNSGKVYRDVVVRVADDAEFQTNVQTIFNNDRDNTSGLGAGTHREYFESHEGKLIDAKGVKGRFLRLYSKGSTESPLNEYTEVEIYGRPAK